MWNWNKKINNLTQKTKTDQNGFSLLELSVAIAILGAALLPITQAFPYSSSIITTSRRETTASYLAQEAIEETMSLGYMNCGIGNTEVRHTLGLAGSYLNQYDRETTIEYVNEDLTTSIIDTGLKKITTTVYYTSKITNNEKSYNLTTLLVEK